MTAEVGGGYLFNSSLTLSGSSEYLDISRAISADSSPMHIASSRTRIETFGFSSQIGNN